MVGFSLSTATADTAAREQFIQLMAIKQSRTEKDKNRTEQSSNDLHYALKSLLSFRCVSKSSALITRN